MFSLQKKIMLLSTQKSLYDYLCFSKESNEFDNVWLFFHINYSDSSQWSRLMCDINNLNKKRNLNISFFHIKKGMLSIPHFFWFLKGQDLLNEQYLKSLLNTNCLIVSFQHLYDTEKFFSYSKIVKRLEKDSHFILVGGIRNGVFHHSKEIFRFFSVPSLDHIWLSYLQTFSRRSQNLLSLFKYHQNKLNQDKTN